MSVKILYISDSAIPSYSADSIHVMKMCGAWAKQGHEVTLLAKNTTACLRDVANVHEFYGVSDDFIIKKYPNKAFSGSGRLYNLMLPFFTFGKYDIAYTRAIYPAFWSSLFKKNIAFEIHEPFNTKSKWLSLIFNFVVRRKVVRKWIVISNPIKEYLIKNFRLRSSNILVAHDGADPCETNISIQSMPDTINVGYVGSLLKGKGMEILYQVSSAMPSVTFHIVGGNHQQTNEWKKKLNKYQSNLVFHGFVEPSQTTKFLKSFDILIAPYLRKVFVKEEHNSNNIAQWMSPLKIFEYMSVEKPIITSDLEVIKEILKDKHTALLCNPDKIDDWVKAITKLVLDKNLAQSLSKNARVEFERNYTWYKRAEKILKFIQS